MCSKRIVILGAIFLLCLLLPTGVKANHSAPVPYNHTAVVNNYSVKYYSYDNDQMIEKGIIPYGTEIEVGYYDEFNNEFYLNCLEPNYGYIKASDLTPLEAFEKNDYVNEMDDEILITENLNIYSGPSFDFKKVGSVPEQTKIKPIYLFGNFDAPADWFYIDYNGIKGWIEDASNNSNVLVHINGDVIISSNYQLKDKSGNIIGSVPNNTIINEYYVNSYAYTYPDLLSKIYITYNGISGFVENKWVEDSSLPNFIIKEEVSCLTISNNVEMYSVLGDFDSKIGVTIPVNTELKGKYQFSQLIESKKYFKENAYDNYFVSQFWTYITYKNRSGWIYNKVTEDINFSDIKFVVEKFSAVTIKNASIVDKSRDDYKVIAQIPVNSKVDIYSYYYDDYYEYNPYYEIVNYNGKMGFISGYEYEEIYENNPGKIVLKNDVKLFGGPGTEYESNNIIIPRNKELSYYCDYNDWKYIEYNGIYGWINQQEGIIKLEKPLKEETPLKEENQQNETQKTELDRIKNDKGIIIKCVLSASIIFIISLITIIFINKNNKA